MTVGLNSASNLTLEIYSLTGQLVLSKDYGQMISGTHTLSIQSTEMNPGVYFYTVTAGENKVTRKMVVN